MDWLTLIESVSVQLICRFAGIVSIDQRREYKSIFDKDYAEYRKLHEEIDRVSKRFAQLEENLRTEERSRKESSKVKVSRVCYFTGGEEKKKEKNGY